MSTADHARHLSALLRKIKGRYGSEAEAEAPRRTPIDELLYSLLLWEATTPKAEAALKRLHEAFVDYNDLRVARPPEVSAVLGKLYPRADDRAARLHAVLTDIYRREHDVTLEPAMKLSKRDAAKYIETLSGMPLFAAARWQLVVLESHHMPVDDRMLAKLVDAQVCDPGSDAAAAAGILQRHVRHDEALRTFNILQAWSEDSASEARPPAKSSRRNEEPTRKKTRPRAPAKKPSATRR